MILNGIEACRRRPLVYALCFALLAFVGCFLIDLAYAQFLVHTLNSSTFGLTVVVICGLLVGTFIPARICWARSRLPTISNSSVLVWILFAFAVAPLLGALAGDSYYRSYLANRIRVRTFENASIAKFQGIHEARSECPSSLKVVIASQTTQDSVFSAVFREESLNGYYTQYAGGGKFEIVRTLWPASTSLAQLPKAVKSFTDYDNRWPPGVIPNEIEEKGGRKSFRINAHVVLPSFSVPGFVLAEAQLEVGVAYPVKISDGKYETRNEGVADLCILFAPAESEKRSLEQWEELGENRWFGLPPAVGATVMVYWLGRLFRIETPSMTLPPPGAFQKG
jgi:hypothetical protein